MKNILRTGCSVLLFLLSLVAVTASAQETYITVSGILKDASTHQRISFASITVPGTGIGTVSNSEGEFILKINASVGAEHFEVAHMSYNTTRFMVTEGMEQDKVFSLEMQPVDLREVTVLDADAHELVSEAFRKVKDNYLADPVMMTGFYRESVARNRDYLSISEAVVDIYKAPYNTFPTDQVRIFKGRKGSTVEKADTLMVELQGGPSVLMMLDVVKNPGLSIAFDDLDIYYFEVLSVTILYGELNWVIGFSPAVISETPLYYGKLYISQEDRAITRCEFSLDLSDDQRASEAFVRKKPAGLTFKPVSTTYLVDYKKTDGRYCINYMRVELQFRCDWRRKVFKKSYSLVSEMAITGRSDGEAERFPGKVVFRPSMIFTSKIDDFADEDFWGASNIIEPEKSIEHAISKLVKSQME